MLFNLPSQNLAVVWIVFWANFILLAGSSGNFETIHLEQKPMRTMPAHFYHLLYKLQIVWDVSGSTGVIEQQFQDHRAPALDVDWKDDTTFASCSTDKTVHICQVGKPKPLKTYTGHTDEVNAVKWDPSGTLLASCSDDCTAKVWNVEDDRKDPMQDFKSHQQEIYTVKW